MFPLIIITFNRFIDCNDCIILGQNIAQNKFLLILESINKNSHFILLIKIPNKLIKQMVSTSAAHLHPNCPKIPDIMSDKSCVVSIGGGGVAIPLLLSGN